MKKITTIIFGILISILSISQKTDIRPNTKNRIENDSTFQNNFQKFKDTLANLNLNQTRILKEIEEVKKKQKTQNDFSWKEILTLIIAIIGGITGVIKI